MRMQQPPNRCNGTSVGLSFLVSKAQANIARSIDVLHSEGPTARYVHPSEDAVLDAMARLGGHNSGHNEKLAALGKSGEPLVTV
jgi:hypothetical protein